MDFRDVAYRSGGLFVDTCKELNKGGKNVLTDPQFTDLVKSLRQLLPVEEGGLPLAAGLGGGEGTLATAAESIKENAAFPTVVACSGLDMFGQLQAAISDGTARKRFPVGTLIPDVWTDPRDGEHYDNPHIVVDYREVELLSGAHAAGAVLLRKYVLPEAMAFSKSGETLFSRSDLCRWLNGPYVRGCSEILLKAVANIVVKTPYINEGQRKAMDECMASFFVPSVEELHVDIGNQIDVNKEAFEYFINTPTYRYEDCRWRRFRDASGRPRHAWLRSYCDYSSVCCASTLGLVGNDRSSLSLGVLPTCIITSKSFATK